MKYLKKEIIQKIIDLNNHRIELKEWSEMVSIESKEYRNTLNRIDRIDLELKHAILRLEKIEKSK